MERTPLDEAVSSFDEWRMQRRYKTEAIPKSLRAMAGSLYPEYKTSIICNRLRISSSQLSQYIKELSGTVSDGFVMAKPPSTEASEVTESSSHLISMTLNGKDRSLHLSVTTRPLLPQHLH